MLIVETPVFTKRLKGLFPDDEYRRLQLALCLRPEQGALVPGGGGVRKMRWSREGKGKRGGTPVKRQDFDDLVKSVKQAGKIRHGKIKASRRFEIKPADIKTIRRKLDKSQSEFALMIGVSVATLRNWEQGRRHPEGPAQALLRVAESNPDAVRDALGK